MRWVNPPLHRSDNWALSCQTDILHADLAEHGLLATIQDRLGLKKIKRYPGCHPEDYWQDPFSSAEKKQREIEREKWRMIREGIARKDRGDILIELVRPKDGSARYWRIDWEICKTPAEVHTCLEYKFYLGGHLPPKEKT